MFKLNPELSRKSVIFKYYRYFFFHNFNVHVNYFVRSKNVTVIVNFIVINFCYLLKTVYIIKINMAMKMWECFFFFLFCSEDFFNSH